MRAAQLDAFLGECIGEHLLEAGLCGPANLVGGEAQIAVGHQQNFIVRYGGGCCHFRNCVGCHWIFLVMIA